jgi:hypothetical protein
MIQRDFRLERLSAVNQPVLEFQHWPVGLPDSPETGPFIAYPLKPFSELREQRFYLRSLSAQPDRRCFVGIDNKTLQTTSRLHRFKSASAYIYFWDVDDHLSASV